MTVTEVVCKMSVVNAICKQSVAIFTQLFGQENCTMYVLL